MGKALLSPKEAAEMLGVSYKTILCMARQKDFPAFRVGERKIRISADALEAWKRRKEAEPLE